MTAARGQEAAVAGSSDGGLAAGARRSSKGFEGVRGSSAGGSAPLRKAGGAERAAFEALGLLRLLQQLGVGAVQLVNLVAANRLSIGFPMGFSIGFPMGFLMGLARPQTCCSSAAAGLRNPQLHTYVWRQRCALSGLSPHGWPPLDGRPRREWAQVSPRRRQAFDGLCMPREVERWAVQRGGAADLQAARGTSVGAQHHKAGRRWDPPESRPEMRPRPSLIHQIRAAFM